MSKNLSSISALLRGLLLTLSLCGWTPAAEAQVTGHVGDIDLFTVTDSTLTDCLKIDAYHGTGDPPDLGTVLVHNNCPGTVSFAVGPWPLNGGSDDPKQFHSGGLIVQDGMPNGATYKSGMVLAVCDASQVDVPQFDPDGSAEDNAEFTGAVRQAAQACADNANEWHDQVGH